MLPVDRLTSLVLVTRLLISEFKLFGFVINRVVISYVGCVYNIVSIDGALVFLSSLECYLL
jgi:hypothetical protein